MKTIYKKCSVCRGTGYVTVTRYCNDTTAGSIAREEIQCLNCDGSGRVETDFFLEDEE